jgi:gamma-glutamyl hercynylcysteine S-oxide synthase
MLSATAAQASPANLLRRFKDARWMTDQLFDVVRPEFLYERPIPERHRVIFYVGHLEAFDWNLLREPLDALPSASAEFDKLFAFGIDPVGGGLPADQPADWPPLGAVYRYNEQLRERIDAGLSAAGAGAEDLRESPLAELLNVAIEHRLMHAETLAYMLHQLPASAKERQPQQVTLEGARADTRMIEIPAGRATLGQQRGGAFGWDNEFDRQQMDVPAFAIDAHMVTNRQFAEFVKAGGYVAKEYWGQADWGWRTKNDIPHPVFWRRADSGWFCRTMFDEVPLPMEWPVYVSHAEASAFARWAGKRLPSEAQWHRAAYGRPDGAENAFPWGDEAPAHGNGNFDFRQWDPIPVSDAANARSAFGVAGMLGNGWEWTSSVFAPLPGFAPRPFYPGYSANFFDGHHYVIKGGSARTAASMLRRSFRNWFQPNYQYVYAGFRCVSN